MPPPAVPHGMCLKVMDDRNMKGGMGSATHPLKFMDQDYNSLQDVCLKTRQRFVDEFFPPDPRSIGEGLLEPEVMARVEWIRPTKLYSDKAEFIVDTVSRFDYAQGNIGNCWFLASVGALTFQNKLLQKVFPDGQSFSHNYTGLFHFRFWRFGKWYDVVIDDKLPTINRKLIFVKSKTYNEFWPALLEKAYAKVCGSYADMHYGRVSEALMDFTGGVHVHYELKTAPTDLWEIMYRAFQSEVLMGCETPPGNQNEERLPNGIVLGHAYTVTKVYQVMSGKYPVQLVRLFNPWGGIEWNGDWSDNSPLWNTVSDEDRKQHLQDENSKEFWMSMNDFLRTFDNMDICCSCPDFLEEKSACHWISNFHHGSWVPGSTAGGCMNHSDTFFTNPQFWLKINEMDKACEQGKSNVLVSLIQKPDKRNRRLASHHGIGFCVFAVPPEMRSEGKFGSSFFYSRKPVATSGAFQDARQVMKLFRLEPGEYLIVPSTYIPNKNAEFILSILCKNEINILKDTERTEKDFLVDLVDEVAYNDKVDEVLKTKTLFRQYSDQYKVVDAEKLQQILHENLLRGNKNTEGFGLDSCRSIIAMSDFSVTGRLHGSEFLRLWTRIKMYKEIFYSMDTSKDGVLSLNELQNALEKTGLHLNEDILSLMVVRYGGASEQISLEGFICLVMRLNCMARIFQRLCESGKITLNESEWIGLTMYS
ncbi:calpain-1 catalytic subunit-like [Rhinichthys klamathensis goyatoka]|uniref:calpain-1 catalytic subunit-like n=1 Tax=Rhinichthys klamathensis goyatoka TaxID=3034132 RepID=UPI0024B4AC78|nr:calpain-1 catalytic subunit-like [Rhinichthys klamathensis goyatoka]